MTSNDGKGDDADAAHQNANDDAEAAPQRVSKKEAPDPNGESINVGCDIDADASKTARLPKYRERQQNQKA